MKRLARLVAVVVALALVPAAARAADSGRIDFVRQVETLQIELQFSSAHDCVPGGALPCAWFPFATRTSTTTPCTPPGNDVVYTGQLQSVLLTQSDSATVPLLSDPAGAAVATRYCLQVIGADGVARNVASYDWGPGSPAPAPTPTPTPTPAPEPASPRAPTPARVFGTRDGKNAMREALRAKFGRSYREPRFFECQRFEDAALFCRARWSTPRFRYDGWVNVTPVGTNRVNYEASITRTSRHRNVKRKRYRFRGHL